MSLFIVGRRIKRLLEICNEIELRLCQDSGMEALISYCPTRSTLTRPDGKAFEL